jgi:hypothetical protein
VNEHKLSLCFLFLIPIFFTLAGPFTVIDLSVWIAHGELFLKSGIVPRHDVFSVLPTLELIYPSFGLSVVYALIYRAVGLLGVCLVHDIGVLSLILYIIYRPLLRNHILPGNKQAKWFLFLFWLGAVPTFVERPAMVALIPLVLSYQIIVSIENRITRRQAAYLILLTILWVNLHGSFILLPVMLAYRVFFLWPKIQTKLLASLTVAGSFLATGLNPFGFQVIPFLSETAVVSKYRSITEWRFPSPFVEFPTGALFWVLVVCSLIYLYRSFQKNTGWITIAQPLYPVLFIGAFSIRNAAMSFVLLLPAAHSLGMLKPAQTTDLNVKKTSNLLIVLALLMSLPLVAAFKPKKWEGAPFSLTQKIKQDGRNCPVFNAFELGSFLMLELPNKIFVDTRNIIYTQATFDAYESALRGQNGAEAYLTEHDACFALVSMESGEGIIKRLKSSPGWEWLGNEGEYTLYSKKSK